MHLSFLTSHNLLFFSLCKISIKQHCQFFLSFSLVKLSKSRSLKLNISRTAWPILMILVSFCRILNGLSNEINLFWRCSSPKIIKHPGQLKFTDLPHGILLSGKAWNFGGDSQIKFFHTKYPLDAFPDASFLLSKASTQQNRFF